ncbi:response regulator [Thiomicrospira microaerophila]|uniref:response regulator n=1 Tax=Thiomicrospira microaerophila TaxID=406020 RepID=UPI00200ECA4C|nr:response regulator [Thiomicrospira microaerophila]UQB42730.1 response regulator [Thiomicrospira microaerophila]
MADSNQVLIVEDDEALSKMIGLLLRGKGYEVFEAINLASAKRVLNSKPDLKCVIQDLGLPPKPDSTEAGLKIMEELLALKPTLKIIVLTGQDKEQAAAEAIRRGAFDFLQKPIAMDALMSSLERAFLYFDTEKDLSLQGCFSVQLNTELDVSGLKESKDEFEYKLLKRVLDEENYHISSTAKRLGVKRENLYYLFRKHDIDPEWVHKMNFDKNKAAD